MEEGRLPVLFDASAYMLFEASGDSEAQYFDGALIEPDSDAAAPAEDDAQSCSCGSLLLSDSARLREGDADDFRGADFDDFSGEEEDDDRGGGSDADDGVVDQRCGGRGNTAAAAAAKEKGMRSNGCDQGSNVKMMNESEGDRLFWEACLAS